MEQSGEIVPDSAELGIGHPEANPHPQHTPHRVVMRKKHPDIGIVMSRHEQENGWKTSLPSPWSCLPFDQCRNCPKHRLCNKHR